MAKNVTKLKLWLPKKVLFINYINFFAHLGTKVAFRLKTYHKRYDKSKKKQDHSPGAKIVL